MSKKFLNKIVSAILVLAICSTAFIGCVVSAAEPVATYNIHDGETIAARDKDGSVEVTFTSDTPFAALNFIVNDEVYDKWAPQLNGNGWLVLSNAEIVADKTVMADGGEVFVPEIYVSSEFDEDANDHINAVVVEGDASANKRYYTTLTLKLTLECTYTSEYVCQNETCDYIYDLELGDETYGIEANTWFTDFPDGKCPKCQANADFVKRFFSYADGYKKFDISISNVEMTDRGSNIWTATANQGENDIAYIHSCTLRKDSALRVSPDDANHYDVQDSYCLYCGKRNYQVVPNADFEYVIDYTTIGESRAFYPDAVNMSYNNDGTVNLNVFIDQSYFVNGRSEKAGDWEPEAIVVTNEQGEIFTRYSGETGQAKEIISIARNDYYEDSIDVDITAEQAAALGFETDTGLRMFSFKNIPASDVGQKLLITILGYRNSERDAGTGESLWYGTTLNYSVADYCYGVINGEAINADDDDKAVAKALLNYGAATQQYFSEETIAEADLANADLSAEDKALYKDIDLKSKLTDTAATKPTNENIFFRGVSAIFRTSPSIKFYFRIFDSENVTVDFKIGDGEVKTVAASDMQSSSTYYAYTISDIGLENMYTPVSFSLKVDGVEVQSGSCSLAGYAVAAEEAGSTELADAMKAMIYYCEKAAETYIA